MDQLLKNAQNIASQGVNSVENLVGGAAQAVASAFQPKPISPVPQAQTMPQAQPSGIQGLLSSLPQETMSAMNMVGQMFNQGEQTAQKTVGDLMNGAKQDVQNVQNFLAPQDNYKPDLSVHYNPQADKGGVTPALPLVQQYINNNGVHFADNIKTGNPVTDWMAKTAAGVPQYIANSPLLAAKAVGQGAQDLSNGDFARPTVAASDVANLAMPVATIATLGAAPEAVDALKATEGFLPKVIQGIVGGTKIGAGFGALGAVGDNRNVTDPLQYVENLASGATQGAAGGAFLGGATGAISGLPDVFKKQTDEAVANEFKNKLKNLSPVATSDPVVPKIQAALDVSPERETALNSAIGKTQSGNFSPIADTVLNNNTHRYLPQADTFNTIDKAKIWDNILDLKDGNMPVDMHPFIQQVVGSVRNDMMQSGRINFGAKVGEEPNVEQPTEASVKMMITKQDEANLGKLGYTPQDIYKMKPQEAGNILDNQIQKPSLKDQLQQPPEQPRMSSQAIKDGIEVPTKGSDISVSPQASKRFEKTGTALDALFGNPNQKVERTFNGQGGFEPYTLKQRPFEAAGEYLPPEGDANLGVKGKGSQSQKVEIGEGSNNIFNKMLNPLKNLPQAVQDATMRWKSGQDSALVAADNTNLRLKALVDKLGITPKQEWALVNYSQRPTPEFLDRLQKAGYAINQDLIDKAKPLLDLHRQLEDQRYNKANSAGIATAYRENHVYQKYLESGDEIAQRIEGRGLNKKPGFTFQKKIPTFLDATEQLALQPKYSTFGQLNALAEHELGKSIANKDYAAFLKDNNRIVPSSQAPRGWKPIMSDNFPRDPETQETYYANPKDAEVINNIFGGQQKTPIQQLLQFTGNLSEKLQSLKLTTPGLSIHGFSIANIVRDQAMALGDAVTGHPVRALRTSGSGIMSALRAFVPGAAESFERDHAYSIKQMADNGLGYSGKQDYRNMQGNVGAKLSTKVLDTGKKVEQAVVTDPTFRKFMFQRKVSLFENFRDSLQSQGYSPEDAAKTAAEQLKSYDGVVNDLGRSPDVKNFLRTFFFAPKYRESIVGAQVNAVKGLFDLNNKDFDFSRRLALGMGMTFLAYNALNMKFTGKPMWQNPAGHEFDLAIPDPNDKTKNYYIPFMPGTTAVPRAVAGTGIALAQGDTDTAEKSFSSLLSSPIQTGIEAFGTKQDYFGRPLFDNTKPLLPQQLGYVASNTFLPSSLNEVGNAIGQAQQGKLNLPIEAARVLQLPIKEGTIPNPFFAARDSQLKTLPLQMQQAYGALQAVSNLDPNDPRRKQVESTLYQAYPQLFDVNKKANIAAAGGDMSKVDPLYTADPAVSKAYLEYQQLNSTAPGSAEEKQYLKNHPEVLQLIQDRSNYFAANPIPQKPGATPYVGAPQASNAVQQLLAAKNYTDPQVQQYLTQHLDYVNQQRAKLGLDPIDQYGNIQGSKNYGGGSGISTSQTAGLRRGLRREFTYENKGESAKVSSMLGKAGNPVTSKKPKMSAMFSHVTRPIGNRKTISTMPKHGKSYKTHSVASLMGSSSTPKFHKLPLPTRGKAKRIFI